MFKKLILVLPIALLIIFTFTACSSQNTPLNANAKTEVFQETAAAAEQPRETTEEIFEKAVPVSKFIEGVLRDKYEFDKTVVVSGTAMEKGFRFVRGKGEILRYVILGPEASGFMVLFESKGTFSSVESARSLENVEEGEIVTIEGLYGYRFTKDNVRYIYVYDSTVIR